LSILAATERRQFVSLDLGEEMRIIAEGKTWGVHSHVHRDQ
jgi:hypothetical protein